MSKKKENVPKVRFPGFTDAWEQRKVYEITLFHKQGFYTTEPYDEKKKYFLLRGTDLTENKLVLKDTPKINASEKEYKDFRVQVGDFLIVRSGTVGTYGIVNTDIPAIFGSYLINFRFDRSVVTNEFFGYFYQSNLFKDQLRQIIQQSANTNINAENIKSTKINFPSIEEQKKIAEFLESLDHLITLHQRKLNNVKKLKSGLLQKMFPKDGEKFPEIRFPEFTDAWEQRKLGELADIVRGASPRPIQDPKWFDKESDVGWLRIADVTEQDGRIYHLEQRISKLGQEKTRVLTESHLLLSIAATVGKPVVNYVKTGVHDGFLIFLKPKFDREFMFQWLEMFRPMWQKYGQPGSQVNLNSDLVKNQEVKLPSYKEQERVGNFFQYFDNLITLHQRKLEHLQKQKKGLLQQMFV